MCAMGRQMCGGKCATFTYFRSCEWRAAERDDSIVPRTSNHRSPLTASAHRRLRRLRRRRSEFRRLSIPITANWIPLDLRGPPTSRSINVQAPTFAFSTHTCYYCDCMTPRLHSFKSFLPDSTVNCRQHFFAVRVLRIWTRRSCFG